MTKLVKLNQIQTYINDKIINFIFPIMAGKIFYLSRTDLIVLKGFLCIFFCYFK